MVTLLLDSDRLEVALSLTERTLSFRKRNIFVPRAQIRRAMLTDDAWTWLRGSSQRATVVPGVLAMGTWKSVNGLDFAIVRRRRPAVVLTLTDHEEFQRIILTTRHGLALVKALRLEGDDEPLEVSEIDAATQAPDASTEVPETAPSHASTEVPETAPSPTRAANPKA